jgi:hypothetical protein
MPYKHFEITLVFARTGFPAKSFGHLAHAREPFGDMKPGSKILAITLGWASV